MPPKAKATLTEEALKGLSHRQLQKECKSRGVKAAGSTEELKKRLLSSTEEEAGETPPAACDNETPAATEATDKEAKQHPATAASAAVESPPAESGTGEPPAKKQRGDSGAAAAADEQPVSDESARQQEQVEEPAEKGEDDKPGDGVGEEQAPATDEQDSAMDSSAQNMMKQYFEHWDKCLPAQKEYYRNYWRSFFTLPNGEPDPAFAPPMEEADPSRYPTPPPAEPESRSRSRSTGAARGDPPPARNPPPKRRARFVPPVRTPEPVTVSDGLGGSMRVKAVNLDDLPDDCTSLANHAVDVLEFK